jgi:ArsR family transcriptional regulator
MISESIATLLRAISQPARVEILLAIGTGEACVCHLEAAIGQRQAYISQQLMALREAGIVTSRRDGRNIYYQIEDPAILDLIQQAGKLSGIRESNLPISSPVNLQGECPCPKCSAEVSISSEKPTLQGLESEEMLTGGN